MVNRAFTVVFVLGTLMAHSKAVPLLIPLIPIISTSLFLAIHEVGCSTVWMPLGWFDAKHIEEAASIELCSLTPNQGEGKQVVELLTLRSVDHTPEAANDGSSNAPSLEKEESAEASLEESLLRQLWKTVCADPVSASVCVCLMVGLALMVLMKKKRAREVCGVGREVLTQEPEDGVKIDDDDDKEVDTAEKRQELLDLGCCPRLLSGQVCTDECSLHTLVFQVCPFCRHAQDMDEAHFHQDCTALNAWLVRDSSYILMPTKYMP